MTSIWLSICGSILYVLIKAVRKVLTGCHLVGDNALLIVVAVSYDALVLMVAEVLIFSQS